MNKLSFTTGIAFLIAAQQEAIGQSYTYQSISYPGAVKTYVEGISNGKAVGYWTDSNAVTARTGFVFDGTSFTSIGMPSSDTNYPNQNSRAYGINSNGYIVGATLSSGGVNLGYLFDGTNYTLINVSSGDHTEAYGISTDGKIVGYTTAWNGNGFLRDTTKPTLSLEWPFEPLLVRIGSNNYLGGIAYGISNDEIVGTYFDVNGAHGYLYDGSTYTPFDISGAQNTYLRGIDGVNLAGYFQDSSGWHGYYYDGTSYHVINAPGAVNTYITGISGNQLSGYYENSDGTINGLITTIGTSYITTTIDQTDSRVIGGGSLNFQGGTLLPTGLGTLNITNGINVITASNGKIDASNRNISASGNVDIQGTNLTLKGTSSSTITLSGAISGPGIIVNESGNNVLSGTNTSGGTLVSGGTLRINSTSSLPATNNAATNGSIILPNGNPGSKTYGQSFSLNGNGDAGQGALILGTSDSSGSLVSNGQITLNGNSTIMTDGAGTGTQTIAGGISGSTSGIGLSLINASGSNAILTSAISSNISSVTKSGAGTLAISGGSVSGNFTITGGLVTLNNVNGLSTTSINTVNGGTLELSNGGGAGNTFAHNFAIAGTGSNGASLSLGTASTTGSLTLSGNIAASANATIRTVGSGTTTATVNGNLNAGSYAVTLDTTTGSNLVIVSQLTANSVNKTSAGSLTLSNAATISASLSVSSGLFTNNGTINGNVTMAAGTSLKGSGVINGQVANSGTVSPGNSPGILSVNGSYTSLTGSTYQAEIGGMGGPGNVSGHDRIVVTGSPGTFTIQGGAGLAALKLNAFEASRGNVFNVYSATGGITGTFNSFTSQFSHWMLLDRATGNMYGTGLTPSQDLSVFMTKFGNTLWNAAVTIKSNDAINGYAGIIDSNTPWGKAVVDVLLGASSIPGSLDPTPYASVTQTETFLMRQGQSAIYGQLETWRHEAIMHDSLTQGFVIGTGGKFTGGAAAGFDLSQNGVLAGLMHALNESCVIGFMGQSGSTGSTFANGTGEANGNAYNLGGFFSATTGKGFDSYFINAGFVFGKSDTKATRNTFFGAQTSTPSSDSKGLFVRVGRDVRNKDGLAMVPYVGIDHSNVNAKSFAENGDATALNVSGFDYSSTRISAGTGINWFKINTNGSAIRFAIDVEGFVEIGSGKDLSIASSFAGDAPFQTKVALGSGNGFALRPSINYDTSGRSSYSLSLGYQSSGPTTSTELQAGYRFRF